MADSPLLFREIPLTGRLRTAVPAAAVGADFKAMKNLRYGETNPVGVAGQTKINATAALANPLIKNGVFYSKDQPSVTRVLVQATDSNDANGKVYRSSATVPAQGNFTTAPLWTDSSGAGLGRFANVPDAKCLYANGVDACIYSTHEMRVAGYQDYDPNGTYKYDYLEAVSNSLSDANNVATVHRYAQTIDAATMLLLSLNNNVTDTSPTTPHTVTNTGNSGQTVLFDTTYKKFGTHGAYFNGFGFLTVPDDPDFDFSDGTWAVDCWIYPTSGTPWVWAVATDANNYAGLTQGAYRSLTFKVVAASTTTVTLSTGANVIPYNTWSHVEVVENGDNYYIFVNGILSAFTTDTDRPANYTGTFRIGAGNDTSSNLFAGYMDEFRVSNTARHTASFSPPTTAYGAANLTNILIGSTLPLQGINWYVGTANTTAGAGAVYYWDGSSWATVGTVTGLGATAWDGAGKESWDFTSTASTAKLKIVDDVPLYWYKVEVVGCDATTTLYQVTLDAAMQTVKDLWDGEYRSCASFQVFKGSTYNDYTTNVFEDSFDSTNEATFAKIGGLTFATDALYIGSFERLQAIKFALVGGYTNANAANACTATVQYWNGSAWTSVAADDQTLSVNASFGKSGMIAWTPPGVTNEFKTLLSGVAGRGNVLNPPVLYHSGSSLVDEAMQHAYDEQMAAFFSKTSGPTTKVSLYYYKITFTGNGTSTAFASDVRLYHIGGIPAQVDVRGYKFPFSHLNRAWLINNGDAEPNVAICSATNTAQVFNGKDSFKFNFGDGTGVVAAASFYAKTQGGGIANLALFVKQKGVFGLAGDTLESIVQYQISDNIGIAAPLTMAVGEVEIAENVSRTVALWQSQRGIEISDGGPPVCISDDIADKFNSQHANYVGDAILPTCTGAVDPRRSEYHWIIPGVAEWVYDIRRKKWFEIVRGAGNYLYGAFPVWDANGVSHFYGFDHGGYMYRLENGTAFDGDAIAHTLQFGDIAPHEGSVTTRTEFMGIRLIGKAKTTTTQTVAVTHYGDSSTTASVPAISNMSMSNSGKDLFDVYRPVGAGNWRYVFHSPKFTVSTSDETIGFEPVFAAIGYRYIGQNTK